VRKFQGIIFDLDGVIVDSEPCHERAFREVFVEMGYEQTHGIDFTAYYGRSDEALWLDFISKHQPAQTLAELTERKQNRLVNLLQEQKPLFAAIPELTEKLNARYRLAVASGSSHRVIDAVLTMGNLRGAFPVTVSAEDVNQGKPAPDIFLRAAELLRIQPNEICVIEDAVSGIEGALAAGMSVIGITNSLPARRLSRATWVVKTYAEIERLLL
jgi:HAD superfamily hydrolase (TIGR01509 family)